MATTSVTNSQIVAAGHTIKNIVASGKTVYRVVAGGNLSYDRKDYELTASGSISIPVNGVNNVASLIASKVTSKYTGYTDSNVKVVGANAGYATFPSAFSSRAHTTGSTNSGRITITQENSQLTNSEITWSQPADYKTEVLTAVTSITLSLGTPAVIPASGGSVNSCSYTVIAKGYTYQNWASDDTEASRTAGTWTVTDSARMD